MNITRNDIIWNYIGTVISLGSNFILLPFILYFLDSNSLGIWYVFLSIGGIVILFDFGFSPTMARNIAYCWSGANQLIKTNVVFIENQSANYLLLKTVIETCKRIYFIISCIALFLMLSIGTYYIFYISISIPGNQHIIAWFIYTIAVFLNLYFGYYMVLLRGVGAIAIMNKVHICSRMFYLFLSIFLLACGFGLIAVAVAYLFYGFLFRQLSKKAFYRHENMIVHLKAITETISKHNVWKTFKIIWHNAWKDGVVSISGYLANQAGTIVCSLYFTLAETGIYAISMQLFTAIALISGALYNAYQPALQNSYINNDIKRSKTLLSYSMVIYTTLYICGFIGLLLFAIPFLSMVKKDVVFDYSILISIGIYIFLLKRHTYYASYISNTNNVPYMASFFISNIFGILLAIFLIHFWNLGILWLVFSQGIVQLAYNNWIWPNKVKKLLDISTMDMIKIFVLEINKRTKVSLTKRNLT